MNNAPSYILAALITILIAGFSVTLDGTKYQCRAWWSGMVCTR